MKNGNMNMKYTRVLACLSLCVFTLGGLSAAHGQPIQVGLSAERGYVGLPLYFQITVKNADLDQVPSLPEIDGCEVVSMGARNQSHQVVVINGRRTESSTVSYVYAITPEKPGTYTIPSIQVSVNGQPHRTQPIRFLAETSENHGELDVGVQVESEVGYVGQAIDLVLHIDVQPYVDKRLGFQLDPRDVWRLIDFSASRWGPFEQEIKKLIEQRKLPAVSQVVRPNKDNENHVYYRYEVQGTFIPKRAGELEFDDLRIVMRYPTSLVQARGFFTRSGEYEIGGVRPLVAQPVVKDVAVKSLPEQGQPKWFTGSVGQFQIVADAEPKSVHEGDPIQLMLRVRGTGEMDFLHAPPLKKVEALTRDFHVPDAPVPGIVRGENKIFAVTIRPRKTGITEIPSIPFSYFNPESAEYQTVWTSPIPIQVRASEKLALDQIVSSHELNSEVGDNSETHTAAIGFEIERGPGVLHPDTTLSTTRQWVIWLVAVPGMVLIFVSLKFLLSSRDRSFALFSGQAEIRLIKRAIEATSTLSQLHMELERACHIIQSNGESTVYIKLKTLIKSCEQAAYDKQAASTLDNIKREALETISGYERTRAGKSRHFSIFRSSPSSAGVLALALTFLSTAEAYSEVPSLTSEQRQEILAEAEAAFDRGIAAFEEDPQVAIAAFTKASERYRLLLESGLDMAALHQNLGYANLHAGDPARAKAHLLKARSRIGMAPGLREAIALAEARLVDPDAQADMESLTTFATQVSDLNSFVSMQSRSEGLFYVWLLLWVSIAAYLGFRKKINRTWQRIHVGLIATCLTITVLLAGSLAWDWSRLANQVEAVAVTDSPTLRLSASEVSEVAADATIRPGDVLTVLQQRDGWVQVRTNTAETGWLASEDLVVIEPVEVTTLF